MENKVLKFFGYWAMGLILFIATMIVIRWTIDFVTWSALDSGWAQVIGSVAALGVAIFVMVRQNKKASQLLIDADQLAMRRRAAAVRAIVDRAVIIADGLYQRSSVPASGITDVSGFEELLQSSRQMLQLLTQTVNTIPAHELGSYDMAEGLHLLGSNLAAFDDYLAYLQTNRRWWGLPDCLYLLNVTIGYIHTSAEQFHRGANEFN